MGPRLKQPHQIMVVPSNKHRGHMRDLSDIYEYKAAMALVRSLQGLARRRPLTQHDLEDLRAARERREMRKIRNLRRG